MEIKALVANFSDKERKNIVRSLKEIGAREVVEATSWNHALQVVQQANVDVAFIDYNMQDEGEALIEAVREIDAKLPVIVTSPQTRKIEELQKDYPAASGYLVAPFNAEQLRKSLSDYIPSLAV